MPKPAEIVAALSDVSAIPSYATPRWSTGTVSVRSGSKTHPIHRSHARRAAHRIGGYLKVLDTEGPIREAEIWAGLQHVCFVPILLQKSKIEQP